MSSTPENTFLIDKHCLRKNDERNAATKKELNARERILSRPKIIKIIIGKDTFYSHFLADI